VLPSEVAAPIREALAAGWRPGEPGPSFRLRVSSDDISTLWPNSHAVASAERYIRPATWPTEVVRLAAAFRAGADCLFALHDALLEAGYPELAKRCHDGQLSAWVVDFILGTNQQTGPSPTR
jgi:hypothetical protein